MPEKKHNPVSHELQYLQGAARPMLVVGNYCHDHNILRNGEEARGLGGAPSFIDALFYVLKQDYDLIAKVGADFAYAHEVRKSALIGKKPTTQFSNDYRGAVRQQRASARADVINTSDLKNSYQVSLACAIAGEMPPDFVAELAKRSKILIVDIQGLIRTFSDDGKVGAQALKNTEYWPLINKITYLKVNPQEAEYIPFEEVRKLTTLILTEGEEGCRIFNARNEVHIPAYRTVEKDPTGAGDSFIAGLGWGLLQGWTAEEACRLGNYCGSVAANSVGVPHYSLPELKKVILNIRNS